MDTLLVDRSQIRGLDELVDSDSDETVVNIQTDAVISNSETIYDWWTANAYILQTDHDIHAVSSVLYPSDFTVTAMKKLSKSNTSLSTYALLEMKAMITFLSSICTLRSTRYDKIKLLDHLDIRLTKMKIEYMQTRIPKGEQEKVGRKSGECPPSQALGLLVSI